MPTLVEGLGTNFRITYRGDADGQAIIHVEDWALIDRINPADAGDVDLELIVNAVRVDYELNVLPLQPDYLTIREIHGLAYGGPLGTGADGPGGSVRLAEFTLPLSVSGGRAQTGDMMPTYGAYSIRKLTSRIGRRFKGGWRLFGVFEDDTDNNLVDPAKVVGIEANIGAYYASIFDDYGKGSDEPLGAVVFSAKEAEGLAGVATPYPEASALVTGVKCSQFVSTQNSRKQRLKFA